MTWTELDFMAGRLQGSEPQIWANWNVWSKCQRPDSCREVVPVATSREQPSRNRRSPRRRIVGPIRASRSLGRAAVNFMRSIGRLRVSPFKQTETGAGGEKDTGRLRKLSDGSLATIRRSITATRGLPARAARQIRRRAGRRGDLAIAIRTNGATPAPADRGGTAHSRPETAVTSTSRTAQRGRQAGERAAARKQDQVDTRPARARAQTRRARQRRAGSPQAKLGQANRRQGLEQRTAQELREQASEAGIKGRSSMTKEQLIKALRSHR